MDLPRLVSAKRIQSSCSVHKLPKSCLAAGLPCSCSIQSPAFFVCSRLLASAGAGLGWGVLILRLAARFIEERIISISIGRRKLESILGRFLGGVRGCTQIYAMPRIPMLTGFCQCSLCSLRILVFVATMLQTSLAF